MADSYPLTLEGQTAKIGDALSQGESAHLAIGAAYNYIVDNKLAEQAGYKNAVTYLGNKFGDALSKSVVMRCSAVVRNFAGDDVTRYGVYKLYELLAYTKLVDPTHAVTVPSQVMVEVPQKDKHTHEEQIVTKPFPECSLSELHAAVTRKKGEPPNLPPADVQAFQQYQDKLTSEIGEHISLKLHAGKDGVARVSLDGVPLKMFGDVVKALAEVEPETPALKVAGT